MLVNELIRKLTELVEEDPALGEAPVMIAHQPRWPLQCGVDGPHVVCEEDESLDELNEQMSNEDDPSTLVEMTKEMNRLREARDPVVYLAEAQSRWYEGRERSPYAPRAAWGSDD